jgi:DNA-binding NarL/FixJ family response regulator
MRAFAACAADFVTKPFAMEELSAKVKSLLDRRKAQKESDIREIESKISRALRAGDSRINESILVEHELNKTERKIIELLRLGLQYKEIGERVNRSVQSVRKRVQSIYTKFNVQNRTELFREIEKRERGEA